MAYHVGCHVIQAISTQTRHVPMAAAPDDYIHQTSLGANVTGSGVAKMTNHGSWCRNISSKNRPSACCWGPCTLHHTSKHLSGTSAWVHPFIWSLPDSQNLIYLINQPEGDNTKDIVSKAIFEKLGKRVSFVYARRVGRKKSDTNRHILIRLKNYCDKDDLFSSAGNSPYVFENFLQSIKMRLKRFIHPLWKELWIWVNIPVISVCIANWPGFRYPTMRGVLA